MSTKLKALGLGLFAVAAMAGFGVMSATAETGGHFNSPAGTTITGFEATGSTHDLEFLAASSGEFNCAKASYHGATGGTVTSVSITPLWSECFTTGSPNTKFDVHENGCTLKFSVNKTPETKDNTVEICATGGPIVITHPECTITVPKQVVADPVEGKDLGATYKTILDGGVHAITLVSTATFKTEYHDKICVLLGTNHTGTMIGSATVVGETAAGVRVPITATGP